MPLGRIHKRSSTWFSACARRAARTTLSFVHIGLTVVVVPLCWLRLSLKLQKSRTISGSFGNSRWWSPVLKMQFSFFFIFYLRYLYDLDQSIEEKIETIAREIYGAAAIEISPLAQEQIDRYKAQVEEKECLGACDLLLMRICWGSNRLGF